MSTRRYGDEWKIECILDNSAKRLVIPCMKTNADQSLVREDQPCAVLSASLIRILFCERVLFRGGRVSVLTGTPGLICLPKAISVLYPTIRLNVRKGITRAKRSEMTCYPASTTSSTLLCAWTLSTEILLPILQRYLYVFLFS
jgi:hypothetical protein